jgi:DNA-binding winged helix-turn-helix (wHTH) protein/tetratricopeptide (TPR) repeat protein
MSSKVLRYEFGNYRLLPSERLLYRAGEKIPLKSKVFETLLTLVRHPGKLLTKDELMTEIWGSNFVEEANLTQYIFTLRKIFGEKPGDHQFIVTVPGRGYRFVAPVETITEAKPENPASGAARAANGKSRSMAVLPLKFLIPKESNDEKYLGLAIADSLITQLSACRRFSVRSTEAVLKYVETEKDAISIGRELDVEVVLSGTIQSLNAKVRANLQLYDTRSGDTLWADKFEFVSTDFFEVQDHISSQAADALVKHGHGNGAAHSSQAPESGEIYQKYIKYRFFWESRTEEGLLASLRGAREIVASAPDFALGYVCVADAYLLLGHHLFLPPSEVYPNVERAVEKALELDPGLAEAYTTKADFCFISRGWESCEKYHRKSIALKPDYASARHWYCWFLIAAGRFDEALEQIEEAQRLDVNSLYLLTVRGVPLAYQRDFDAAIRQFRLVLEIDPNFKRAHYYLAWALFHAGRREEAVAEFEKVVAAEPIQQTIALLGYCYGKLRVPEKAYEMLRRIARMEYEGKYVSPYHRAMVYAGLGDKNQALTELEKAFEENSIWLIWLKVDFQFEDLHDEPRFQDLIKRLNFPK